MERKCHCLLQLCSFRRQVVQSHYLRVGILCVALVCGFLAGGRAAEPEEGSVSLTAAKYAEFLENNSLGLLFFYAPWCHWSRNALPEFDAAARVLMHHHSPVMLAKVNCAAEKNLCSDESIRSFPTIVVINDGRKTQYTGSMHRANILHWVDVHLDNDKLVGSVKHLDELLSNRSEHPVVIAVLNENSPAPEFFPDVAHHFADDMLFAHVNASDVVSHLQSQYFTKYLTENEVSKLQNQKPLMVMFRPYDDEPLVVYVGSLKDKAEMTSFVRANRFPAFVHFSYFWTSKLFSDGRPLCVLVLDSTQKDSKESQEAVEALKSVAVRHRADMLFTISGNEDAIERRMLDLIAGDEQTLPLVRVITFNPQGTGYFHPALKFKPDDEGPMDLTRFSDFVGKYLAKKLSPILKSESSVVQDEYSSVKPLVGNTFEEVVFNHKKDVLVEFYAPWCGHCRKMVPAYKELAACLKHLDYIDITMIDATRNDVPNVYIQGYPTLMLYSADKKDHPVVYRGDRSVNDMLAWLSTRVSQPFEMSNTCKQNSGTSTDGSEDIIEEL